jgi:hypothetical protein
MLPGLQILERTGLEAFLTALEIQWGTLHHPDLGMAALSPSLTVHPKNGCCRICPEAPSHRPQIYSHHTEAALNRTLAWALGSS